MRYLFLVLFLISSAYGATEVEWKDLKSYDSKKKGSEKSLSKFINKEVQIKGFMIPLDYNEKDVKTFLLVPFVPACMHVPPPASNQIIEVEMKKGKAAHSYYPVEIKGKFMIEKKAKEFFEGYIPPVNFKLQANSFKEIKE